MKTLLLLVALAILPGCLLVAGAAVGAGIVYAAGDDTAEVRVDANAAAAFAASREEVIRRGTLETSDSAAGLIEAKVGTSNVTVTILEEPDGLHTRVTVKARTQTGLGPDMETARILATAIVRRTM